MMPIGIPDLSLEIRAITQDDLDAILQVYQQCEDFLALGPVASASMEMVAKDLEESKHAGGVFCGIYTADGKMIGVVDYVPSSYDGNPYLAYLSLLMIAAPFRKRGIGTAVVEAIEAEISKDSQVTAIRAGVQVNNPQAIHFWQMHGYRIVGGPEFQPDQTTAFGLRKDIGQGV